MSPILIFVANIPSTFIFILFLILFIFSYIENRLLNFLQNFELFSNVYSIYLSSPLNANGKSTRFYYKDRY